MQGLSAHRLSEHGDHLPRKCGKCDETFITKVGYLKHRRTVHGKVQTPKRGDGSMKEYKEREVSAMS